MNDKITGKDFINNNKLLLKICTNTATNQDIDEWSKKNNIGIDDLDSTLEKLITSFNDGSNQMEQKLFNNKNEKIIIKLHFILKSLNTLTNEVNSIISEIDK